MTNPFKKLPAPTPKRSRKARPILRSRLLTQAQLTAADHLTKEGIPPALARLLAARDIETPDDGGVGALALPTQLLGIEAAAARIVQAMDRREMIVIAGDYDADGATATSVAVAGLKMLGAEPELIAFFIPDRIVHGYGLSAKVVDAILEAYPLVKLIITVDNGMASIEGVAHAGEQGIDVVVTDHHLPGEQLPAAVAIVNPNQVGCEFPSKRLAGCGVMFYVLFAIRSLLRVQGAFVPDTAVPVPKLADLLDLVALGTVADVVALDRNNRILVTAGLTRIRSGMARPGIIALMETAKITPARCGTRDLGFTLAPQINAAGRLSNMRLGIECLLAEDLDHAQELAVQLKTLNDKRREVERGMTAEAGEQVNLDDVETSGCASVVAYNPGWHEGVVGLVASRLRERTRRPAVVFARTEEGTYKGSGRSIAGFHLRDALVEVDAHNPGLILKFGGHAGAAGLTLCIDGLDRFREAFDAVASAWITPDMLEDAIVTDGELANDEISVAFADQIAMRVWGQGCPEPLFQGVFTVAKQDAMGGGKHRRIGLKTRTGLLLQGVAFRREKEVGQTVEITYRLSVNEWNDRRTLQVIVDRWVDDGM